MSDSGPRKLNQVQLRRLFKEVRNQLYRLHTHWTPYLALYGQPRTVELLRASAMVTFGAVQAVLIEAIYIGTQRLLDQSSPRRGHPTASIESLIRFLPPGSAALRRRLRPELEQARKKCVQLAEWRDRVVAHRDLATALDEHPMRLGAVKASTVGDVIQFLAGALTAISEELDYDSGYNPHQELADLDVHELIRRLQIARHL